MPLDSLRSDDLLFSILRPSRVYHVPAHFSLFTSSLFTSLIPVRSSTVKRYALSQNVPANEVPGYFDDSITLSHDFNFRNSTLGLKLELLNIADNHYEIIRNYPMQGFGLRFKVVYDFGR